MLRKHPDVIALLALSVAMLTNQGGAPTRPPTLASADFKSADFKIDRQQPQCATMARVQTVLQRLAHPLHRTNVSLR